jgi:Domain of unknown function (DUF4062)
MRFPAETQRRGDQRRENMAEGAEDSGVGARVRGGGGDELQRRMALGASACQPSISARIGGAMAYDPVVFISSTSDDLKDYREQAAKAAVASGFAPRMMEYFPASGHLPTVPACLEKVAEAEVVVVIVAHRYGWVPDDPANPDAKSITWLECDYARQIGKEVLAFLVDPSYKEWRTELREDYRLVTERKRPGRRVVTRYGNTGWKGSARSGSLRIGRRRKSSRTGR